MLREGFEHGLSPMDAPSLLEAGARIQSENAIAHRGRFLSVERPEGCDTLHALSKQQHQPDEQDAMIQIARQPTDDLAVAR
jgi:hypothetical protein